LKEARFYISKDDSSVICDLCHHGCKIENQSRGLCGVRINKDGKLYSMVYGKASGLNLDPIEKKPLYHFLPGTKSLSLGAYGCNFSCMFCQNHELSQSAKKNPESLCTFDLPPEKIVEQAVKLKSQSISYTYSEPTVWSEYALDTIELARKEKIKAVFVSNGFQSDRLADELIPVLDAINIDLKSFSDDFYQKYAKARLKPVLENIRKFHRGGVHVEITTLVIPSLNDSTDELKKIAEFIASIDINIPWHISRFFPQYKLTNISPTPLDTLNAAYDIGKEAGLHFVYLGNVNDVSRSSTYCPECGEMLIRRDGYSIEILGLTDGKCNKCSAEINMILK
jgi:pyruvate formate lyase activating enzyme